MQQVKCSVHNVMYILLYTRTAVLVIDAHNKIPGTHMVGVMHDDIRVHMKGACFAIPASPPTTLGWPGLQ